MPTTGRAGTDFDISHHNFGTDTAMKLQHTLTAATLLLLTACTTAPREAEGPDPDTLLISGDISPEFTYKVRVDYATTLNSRGCQYEDYITGMWIAEKDHREFTPTHGRGNHSLALPLSREGAKAECAWQPQVISLCLQSRATGKALSGCQALFILRPEAPAAAPRYSVHCDPGSGTCTLADGAPVRQTVHQPEGEVVVDIVAD